MGKITLEDIVSVKGRHKGLLILHINNDGKKEELKIKKELFLPEMKKIQRQGLELTMNDYLYLKNKRLNKTIRIKG